MSALSQPLSRALTPKRSGMLPAALLTIGLLVAIVAALMGFIESRRTERIVIATTMIPYGQQIQISDLTVIEAPLHRPLQLAGMADPQLVVGRWAAREIGPNDLLQPGMLLQEAPDQPVFPNGRRLEPNMVPIPFPVGPVGPLSDRDVLNIGFVASNPALCVQSYGQADGTQAYTCRWLTAVPILYIDGATAYLPLTPYQAQALRVLQAEGVQFFAERYGSGSDALPPIERMRTSDLDASKLLAPAPTLVPAVQESDRPQP